MVRRHFISVSYSEDVSSNQIWYKTSNGEKFEYSLLMDFLGLSDVLQANLLKEHHLIHDGWWCLTFTDNITFTGTIESEVGPTFLGLLDTAGVIETNILNVIEIKLPSISFIGELSFSNCVGLQSITIPDSVIGIGNIAFDGCSSLTSVIIPDGVTSIGNNAFGHCSSLPVENNIRYADTYLIEAVDESLSTYSIKNGTKWIGSSAFYGCSSLTTIVIPDSVISIGNGAFHDCHSLTSFIISISVTSIGDEAFFGCDGLTSITIPNSVKSIGVSAFSDCSSLTSITFNGTIDQWESVELGYNWNYKVPATVVHCTDGDVTL